MILLLLLGVLSITLLFLNSYILFPLSQDKKLLRVIISIVLCESFIWFIIEFLNLFHSIKFSTILVGWILFVLLNLFICGYHWRFIRSTVIPFLKFNIQKPIRMNLVNMAVGIFIVFQIGVLSYLAYSYPPNNWDSMTYHMARVMHWSQNQSISPYPTNILRQIQLSPFAEYQILTVYTLTGDDHYVNFVQLFAYTLCLLCIVEISNHLKNNQHQVTSTLVLGITLPMAILQATSTQNDLVVSSLQASFVAIGLAWTKENHHTRLAYPAGLSLGLALLTKATTMVFMLPFCVYFGYLILKRFGKSAIKSGILVAFVLLTVNIGYWARNYGVFGSLTGPSVNVVNDIKTVDVLSSNLIRNTALHFLPYPNGVPVINYILNKVLIVFNYLHSNVSSLGLTDQRTSWTTWNVFTLSGSFHEDTTGNPIHATLIIFALSIFGGRLIINKRSIKPTHYCYGLCIITGIVLFSWLLKWQPWGSRLQLPFFILAIPFVATYLFRYDMVFLKYLNIFILLAITGISLIWLFNNATRPFIPYGKIDREKAFFANIPSMEPTFREMVDSIPLDCKNIGLAYGDEGYEYPLWALLKQKGFDGRIDYTLVNNQSSKLGEPKVYCSIISMTALENLDTEYTLIKVGEYYIYNQKKQ